MSYSKWKEAVLALIPGRMIYEIDLKSMFKDGMTPESAVQLAESRKLIENRPPNSFIEEARKKRLGRPRTIGIKRKPLWDLATVTAKVESAVFAVCREAETHSLTEEAVHYVRGLQERLIEEIRTRRAKAQADENSA